MFLLDDLLTMPARGLMNLFQQIHDQVDQETEAVKASAKELLLDLYMQLETGAIDQQTFDRRESELVAQLEKADSHPAPSQPSAGKRTKPGKERRCAK